MGWRLLFLMYSIQHKLNSTMKFLKYSFVIVALIGLTTIWGCKDTDDDPATMDGTWIMTAASANGSALSSPSMTVTFVVTDNDGNGTFSISNVSSNVVAFNGQTSGTYTISGSTSVTFTSGSNNKTVNVTKSPLDGGNDWVVTFTGDLDNHGDKNNTAYEYTFVKQ